VTDRAGEYASAADSGPRIDVGQLSVIGRVRTGNEDSVLCEPPESLQAAQRGLFCAVADGMGGHAAGEEASQLAVQVAHRIYYETNGMDPLKALRLAVVQANTEVFEAGAGTTGRDHMGSTLTAAVMFNDRVVVGHVGDSRAYIVRGDAISPLTRDHSWVAEEVAAGRMSPEQARISPRRNIITRALGLREDVEVDVYEASLQPGDLVVICSDGLHGLVRDDEILAYVQRLRPADSVASLVQLANERGGPDNISIVVARVRDAERDESDTERRLPILTESMMATMRTEVLPSETPTEPMPVAASSQTEPSLAEMPTVPGMAAQMPPVGPPPAAYPPAQSAPSADQTPPAQMMARTGQMRQIAPRERQGGRSGGVKLILLLVFLMALGVVIALGLAYLTGFSFWGGAPAS
jgi:serine/threonine protein phosphatase PrpC